MNENQNDWDEHMSIVLFSYITAFKVGIGHTLFQLVYILHSLLPIKHLLPSKLGKTYDPKPIRVLTSCLLELKKL